MATNNTASIAQARKLVEQLKMEANIDRIKVGWNTVVYVFKKEKRKSRDLSCVATF